jgi:hypothetical protein
VTGQVDVPRAAPDVHVRALSCRAHKVLQVLTHGSTLAIRSQKGENMATTTTSYLPR